MKITRAVDITDQFGVARFFLFFVAWAKAGTRI